MPGYGIKPEAGQGYDLGKGFNAVALSMREGAYKNSTQLGGMIDVIYQFATHADSEHFVSAFTDACKTFEELNDA